MNEPEFYQRADELWDWRVVNVENGGVVGNSGGQGFRDAHDAERGFQSFLEGLKDWKVFIEIRDRMAEGVSTGSEGGADGEGQGATPPQ